MTTWTVGEAAEKCGLSQHTLRWYERIGLLPAIERGSDGRRRYGDSDLDWLSLLTKLRATGMPVRDMQRYAELVRSGAGQAERIASEAAQLLTADPCPHDCITSVIIGSEQMALQVHESCGHPTELDRVLGHEAAYAGTSFLTPDLLGTFQIQGYSVSGLEAVYQAVEHFGMHHGQILYINKLVRGKDLGFYRELDKTGRAS